MRLLVLVENDAGTTLIFYVEAQPKAGSKRLMPEDA
jgi:hypothetical protein